MRKLKLSAFFKNLENSLLFLVFFLFAINTLLFISHEVSQLSILPYLQLRTIYIFYSMLLFLYLGSLTYILRHPIDLAKFIPKMILFVLPSALLLAWGLSTSIHYNLFFRLADYLFFIFVFFYLIYRYKKYPKISSFLKDIFVYFRKEPGKKNTGIASLIIIALVIMINLYFGLSSLSKHAAVDEPLWTQGRITKYWNNIADGEYQKTMVSDKPGITVAIISGIGLNWVNPFDYKDLSIESTVNDDYRNIEHMYWAMRLPIYLFNILLLILFYRLIKYLLDEKIALLSLVFIGLSPILIGISAIVNPDSLLWIFAPLSFLGYLCYLKDRENRFLYFSGIFLGLAVLTKYVANIFYVFFPVLIFLEFIINREKYGDKRFKNYMSESFFDYFILVFFSLVTVFIFLPAAWLSPAIIFQATLFSKAFLKIWVLFLLVLGLISLDAFFLASRGISSFLKLLSRFRSVIFRIFFAVFLFFTLATLVDVYLGMKPYDLEAILASPKSSYAVNNIFGLMLANFYSALFGIMPIALLSMLFLIIFNLRKKDGSDDSYRVGFYLLFFVLIYYVASIVEDVSATVRYQIIIYPLVFIIAAIGLVRFLEMKKIKKYFSYNYAYPLLIIFSLYSLFYIKPFYFSYASSLLPKQYVLNVKDMGDGSYEAARYLNKLPNAEKLNIWTDKRGVCAFFVGQCHSGVGYNQDVSFDYFVVSSGREKRTTTMTLSRYNGGNNKLIRLDKLYNGAKPEYKLEIGGRPDNYVKVINANSLN